MDLRHAWSLQERCTAANIPEGEELGGCEGGASEHLTLGGQVCLT